PNWTRRRHERRNSHEDRSGLRAYLRPRPRPPRRQSLGGTDATGAHEGMVVGQRGSRSSRGRRRALPRPPGPESHHRARGAQDPRRLRRAPRPLGNAQRALQEGGRVVTYDAKAQMVIRRPVADVFEAFVDPDVTTNFWFTKSSGRLLAGQRVTWTWESYDAHA